MFFLCVILPASAQCLQPFKIFSLLKKFCLVADHKSAGLEWVLLFASLNQPRPQVLKEKGERSRLAGKHGLGFASGVCPHFNTFSAALTGLLGGNGVFSRDDLHSRHT